VGRRGLRILWHAQIDHPTGIVDVFNTHLPPASTWNPVTSPAAGVPGSGRSRLRDCQAVQVASLVRQRAAPIRCAYWQVISTPNRGLSCIATWSSPTLDRRLPGGGNPECDPATGIGCTSGRADEDLSDMESPQRRGRRIDYLFLQYPLMLDLQHELDSHRTTTATVSRRGSRRRPDLSPALAAHCRMPSAAFRSRGVAGDINCR